ncbi:hypothetical protein [Mesorhizobium australicum]|uniref:hypothetical protein n=1 Tax=Mesorhizobium australicum TaxID=536018 RepID=UPI00333D1CFA
MQAAEITEGELITFQKVVAIMEDGLGRIDGDDLIAASLVNDLSPDNVADHADTQQAFESLAEAAKPQEATSWQRELPVYRSRYRTLPRRVGWLGLAPAAILAGAFSGSALVAFVIDPHGAWFSPTALAGLACASIAGGLLGSMAAAAYRQDDADPIEGIVLVTAHVRPKLTSRWLCSASVRPSCITEAA